ncbi:hypothetical protein BZA05DRAFT_97879 [Tricharina praecox]|uniref:uncharacterized protein n=1 Tax=Tricharina praecox TaxID=43433 RepID=UPI00221F8C2A|nr:uncharacterized protein BZA05DRAFT_97879 [Tricharina praecox]KAI5857503.1 hypothetical protein BZA05DRAFT_97879 [Tricharina praecox]
MMPAGGGGGDDAGVDGGDGGKPAMDHPSALTADMPLTLRILCVYRVMRVCVYACACVCVSLCEVGGRLAILVLDECYSAGEAQFSLPFPFFFSLSFRPLLSPWIRASLAMLLLLLGWRC